MQWLFADEQKYRATESKFGFVLTIEMVNINEGSFCITCLYLHVLGCATYSGMF